MTVAVRPGSHARGFSLPADCISVPHRSPRCGTVSRMRKDNLNVRLGESLYVRVCRAADKRGLNLSNLTRMIVLDWLERNE